MPSSFARKHSTAFVDPERLGSISRGFVGVHQAPIAGFAKGLERNRLLGPRSRLRKGRPVTKANTSARQAQGAAADVRQLPTLRIDPRSLYHPEGTAAGSSKAARARCVVAAFQLVGCEGLLRLVH